MVPQDSAKFWFPKLQAAELWGWLPNTVMIDYDEVLLAPSLRGKQTVEYERLYHAVEAAIRYEIAGPAFIRTDLTSAKHAGRGAYAIDDEGGLNHALLTTLSIAELKSYHSKVKSSAIMVRPLLQFAGRTAFGGLPIGREYRIFADQHRTQCWHGYWPQEALENHMDDGKAPDWSDGVASGELFTMKQTAKDAAKAMGAGKWSIDFAKDVKGKWWLLDMATAKNSYHASPCQFRET
jgi:hypothetical protein